MNAKVYFLAISALLLSLTAFAEIKIHDIQNATSATTADGKIAVFIEGAANGTYKIVLSGTASNTKDNVSNGVHTFDGLRKGAYTIKVTNKTNTLSGGGSSAACDKIFNVTIGVCSDNAITMTETKSPLVCDGAKDGFINITAQGGTPPYKYAWNIGKTTEDVSNLEGDKKYKVTVTDNQGCKLIKEIMVDGQKIEANLVVVKNSNSCDGELTLKAKVIGLAGTLSYEWDRNLVVSPLDPSLYTKACNGKHQVVIKTQQGCSITVPFKVFGCTSTPLTFQTTDWLTNKPSKEYCNPNSKINVQIFGGTLPIKCELLDDKKQVIFTEIAKIPNRNISLPAPKSKVPIGHYLFQMKDACGNTAVEDFHCDCEESEETFFEYFTLTADKQCEIGKNKSELRLIGRADHPSIHSFVNTRNYTIFWDNIGKVEVSNFGDYGGVLNSITLVYDTNGPKSVIVNTEGAKSITIKDKYGCNFEYCSDFGNEGSFPNCKPKIDKISLVYNPKYPVYLGRGQDVVSGDIFTPLCRHTPPFCKDLGKKLIDVSIFKKFTYVPEDKYHPCKGGTLTTQCGSLPMMGSDGGMYVNLNSRENSSEEGVCEYKCACVFDNGLNGTDVYVDDVPYLVESIDCVTPEGWANDILPPSPPEPQIVSNCERFDKSQCDGGRHFYTGKTNYNDCFFDVTCEDKDTPGQMNLIYQNCPFAFRCCYDYDAVAKADASKILFFPTGYLPGTGQRDLVKWCRWEHPNNKNIPPDNAKFHLIQIVAPNGCNNSYSDCQDFTYKRVKQDEGSLIPLPQENFKFLQMNEVYAEVYPNPFEQSIDFRLYHNKGKVLKIVLSDILGRLIQANDIDTVDGNIQFSIDVKDKLPKGMYIISLEGEDFRLQYPLVHQ